MMAMSDHYGELCTLVRYYGEIFGGILKNYVFCNFLQILIVSELDKIIHL